jgi:hypothetical protein
MPVLNQLLAKLGILAAVFIMGFTSGFYTKAKFYQASEVKQVNVARAGDAKQEEISQAKSALLAKEIETRNEVGDSLKKEIKRYVPRKPKTTTRPAIDPAGSGLRLDRAKADGWPAQSFLTRGELWVLNSARAGGTDPATRPSDGEGVVPAAVAREDFLENDIEIAIRFNNLKRKHDELVDWVAGEVKKRQQRRQ